MIISYLKNRVLNNNFFVGKSLPFITIFGHVFKIKTVKTYLFIKIQKKKLSTYNNIIPKKKRESSSWCNNYNPPPPPTKKNSVLP